MKCTGQGRARAIEWAGLRFRIRKRPATAAPPPLAAASARTVVTSLSTAVARGAAICRATFGCERRCVTAAGVFFFSVVFISVVASVNSCCFYFFVEKKGVTSSRVGHQVLTPGNILMSHKKLIESKVSTCLSIMSVDTLCGAFS